MKLAVAYTLTEGHVPNYILDGGYYEDSNGNLIGVTIDNPTLPDNITIFETIEELTAYLDSYKLLWQQPSNPTWIGYQPDTPTQAAEFIWQKLTL